MASGGTDQATTTAAASTDAMASPSSKSCLTKHIVQKDGPAFDFEVIVPSAKQALAKDAGYSPVPCSSDAGKAAKYRDTVCDGAQGNDAVRNRWIAVLGIDPRKMCPAAREAVDGVSAE